MPAPASYGATTRCCSSCRSFRLPPRYMGENDFAPFPTALYAATLLLAGLAFIPVRWSVMAQLKDDASFVRLSKMARRKNYVSLGLYAISISLGLRTSPSRSRSPSLSPRSTSCRTRGWGKSNACGADGGATKSGIRFPDDPGVPHSPLRGLSVGMTETLSRPSRPPTWSDSRS